MQWIDMHERQMLASPERVGAHRHPHGAIPSVLGSAVQGTKRRVDQARADSAQALN